MFPKLPQCSGLRFAIGSVRARVPFRAKPAIFADIQTGPVFSRTRLMDYRAAAPLHGYARQTVWRAD